MSIDLITLAYSELRKRIKKRTNSYELNNNAKSPEGRFNRSVSVFIPTFNEAEKLSFTINHIIQQTYSFQDIYILDDLSTDRTKEVCEELKKKHDSVRHIRREEKLGKAGNINALVHERADELGELILVVDGDVQLEKTCLEELVKYSENAAVVTGFGYTRKPSSYISKMLYEGMCWINAVFSFRKKAQTIRNAVFVVCGALSLYRKDVLDKIPIPERTLTEDTDYTWVLQEKGYRVKYNEKARAVGRNPESFIGNWKRHIRWFSGTFQNLYIHGFKELRRSKTLFYSTILPGCLEVIPYSVIITSLPVMAIYYPNLAKGVLIADFVLSSPFLFFHPKGFWYAVNHLPDIYAYKYFGAAACLYAGIKTTIEKMFGNTDKWMNNWENSSRANIQAKQLTKRYMKKNIDAFLYLEKEWTGLGEKAWTKQNFILKKSKKWKLSNYVSLNGKPVGYTIVSDINKGQAYLHKILVDSDYQGLGIGSHLLEDVIERCRRNKIKKLHFKVRLDNEAANAIYRKNNVVYLLTEKSSDGVERYLCELDIPESKIVQKQ
ncbi:MAG: GNAT family N-acetyltransferase [Planctomycetota bacterium]|jgi:cellulose synthase/poly-beta-1,6-N-acetylglucosamine synthase-like glycosyltransferase/ribosomal protein S18 acetylase RimI-like enzyme